MNKRLEKLLRAHDILRERKMKLEVGIFHVEDELIKEAVKELKVKPREPKLVGDGYGHECPESPIDTCVYDEDEDPCMDTCLFCGDPWERK